MNQINFWWKTAIGSVCCCCSSSLVYILLLLTHDKEPRLTKVVSILRFPPLTHLAFYLPSSSSRGPHFTDHLSLSFLFFSPSAGKSQGPKKPTPPSWLLTGPPWKMKIRCCKHLIEGPTRVILGIEWPCDAAAAAARLSLSSPRPHIDYHCCCSSNLSLSFRSSGRSRVGPTTPLQQQHNFMTDFSFIQSLPRSAMYGIKSGGEWTFWGHSFVYRAKNESC